MRPLLAAIVLLGLTGCVPQAHHDEAGQPLVDRITAAVEQEYRDQGLDPERLPPTRRRMLERDIGILIGHGQDEQEAIAAIDSGLLSPATVRRQGVGVVERISQRRGEERIEPLLLHLLRQETWTTDETVLVRLLTRWALISNGQEAPEDWGP